MKNQKIFVADFQVLIQEGLASILNKQDNYEIVNLIESKQKLFDLLNQLTPSILIIDPFKLFDFLIIDLEKLTEIFPSSRILVITDNINTENINTILRCGISHIITKNCTKDELLNSIISIGKNENFLCKEVIETLLIEKKSTQKIKSLSTNLTQKEIEIIKLLTEGLSTKEIASKENLSIHTINTHRKNILKKLGINNTSELIMYAIKNGIVDTTEYYI